MNPRTPANTRSFLAGTQIGVELYGAGLIQLSALVRQTARQITVDERLQAVDTTLKAFASLDSKVIEPRIAMRRIAIDSTYISISVSTFKTQTKCA